MLARDFTGYSENSLNEAIENALNKVGEHSHFEVIETRSWQPRINERHYQVTLTAFCEPA